MEKVVEVTDVPSTLVDFIQAKWHFSHRMVRHLKGHEGCLRVNNRHATVRESLHVGDIVTITFPPEERGKSMIAEDIPLEIVYENDDFLIVNKRAQLAVSPSANHSSGTLANGVIHYYDQQQLPYTVHIVTRLDRGTTGLILIAKHAYMHALFSQLLERNEIHRSYEAIVIGNVKKNTGVIDEPISRKEGSIIERTVHPRGKKAVTHYKVCNRTDQYSHVVITLETGRTHQIRVHFSSIGHPLVGDTLYGTEEDEMNRHALHCSEIAFIDPRTDEQHRFTIPLPNDMKNILQNK